MHTREVAPEERWLNWMPGAFLILVLLMSPIGFFPAWYPAGARDGGKTAVRDRKKETPPTGGVLDSTRGWAS